MKRLIAIFVMSVMSFMAVAQTSIKVQAPNVVAADEQFNVAFIIEGENSPSDFSWDAGDDFQLVWGPQKGSSTYTSIINGKRTRSSQFTYTYILLPKKSGKFTLPEAHATVKGNKLTSERATVEVVSGGSSSQSSSSRSSSGSSQSASATGEIPSEDLFLRFSLSRTNVVVGEPVTATLKLYQRVNIAGFEDARFPTFNGFWSQEVLAPSNIEFQRENLNDKIYNSAVLRSYVLIPQQSGDIVIDPAELVCLVNVRTSSGRSNSIFDSFFQDDYRTIRKRVTSDSYKVHVSPLPAGAPASFGGGVGTFSLKAEMSKDSLKTHDAASLVVTVSGKGNVSLLEAPKINFPPDFEVYDTKVSESTDKSNGKTTGSKTFEYPFIPRSHGSFELPPVEYSYYDINTGKYVTLYSDPITVRVGRGNESDAASAGGQMISGTIQKDVRSLGSDIRFIATKEPSFSKKGELFLGSSLFFSLLVLIMAAAAAAWYLLKKYSERRADVVGSKNRAATKMAQKRLQVAEGYLKNSLYTAFYEELHKALLGFISDKLNIDLADMNKENISASLVAGGVSEDLASSFNALLDACEFARYAPDAGNEAMSAHYESAVQVISSIDASMKSKKNSKLNSGAMALVIALLMVPCAADAAQNEFVDSKWNDGVSAFADGDWDSAVSSWSAIESMGFESSDLFYNLGNAYFKGGDYAHAILYYERALKLDPSHSDARFNLEFANSMIQDRIESVPEFFLKTWFRKICWLLSSDSWAVMFLLFIAAALACAVLFLLSASSSRRRLGFFAGLAMLVLSLCALGFSSWQKSDYRNADTAVVTAPVSSVKSSPGSDSAKDLFVLHEGTKVNILDTVGSWNNIELSDGRQGWIKSSDLEII